MCSVSYSHHLVELFYIFDIICLLEKLDGNHHSAYSQTKQGHLETCKRKVEERSGSYRSCLAVSLLLQKQGILRRFIGRVLVIICCFFHISFLN